MKAARRRRRKSPAARIRPFWIVIVAVLVVAGVCGYAFAKWPGFLPKSIVVSGERVVSRDEVLAKAQIDLHRNVWLQSPSAMEARIERIPYIATAAVHRLPPANVVIDVTERMPFAVVTSDGSSALVDHDLRVLEADDGKHSVPRITIDRDVVLTPGAFIREAGVRQLRNDDDRLVAAHVIPAEVSFDKYGELVVTMHDGVHVLLGDDDDDFQKKIRLIDPILAQLSRSQRPIQAIDLRAPNTPVVQYKNR